MKYLISLAGVLLCFATVSFASPDSLMRQGWAALVQDKDAEAIFLFSSAYDQARNRKDTVGQAEALLHLGICSYGSSLANGMAFANKALALYHSLETTRKDIASEGRSRCLQLVSTIASRQGRYEEAIQLSKQAIKGLVPEKDSTGTLGLAYFSLGNLYARLRKQDSSDLFFEKALAEHLKTNNTTYLPGAYVSAGDIALRQGNKALSLDYYQKSLQVADRSGNQQSRAASWLALTRWQLRNGDIATAEAYCQQARTVGATLKDKVFYLKALEQLITLKKQQQDFEAALQYTEEKNRVSDTLYTREKDRMTKSLEAQFRVSEKERELELLRRQKSLSRQLNYMLTAGILILLLGGLTAFLLQRRLIRRDRQLLKANEELGQAREREQELRDQYLQHELAYKESQMSALTLQMLQKNELLLELKEKLDRIDASRLDSSIEKIVNQGLNRDKEWADFNLYFESINKHFYSRLRERFPEISANDLKLCALIRLNLSSKDMANILNISPDSVKTARYRLRKKLQLNTEDNLTAFILQL